MITKLVKMKNMNRNFGLSAFFRSFVPKYYICMQNPLILKPSMTDTLLLPPFVDEAAEAAGISDLERKRLLLAVEEAVANVINYGQATEITLRAAEKADRLVLIIDDDHGRHPEVGHSLRR